MASDHVTLTSALASVKGSDSGQAASRVCDHIIRTNVPAADTSINSAASVMTSVKYVGKKQADTCTKELGYNTRLETSSNVRNNELANEEINESYEEMGNVTGFSFGNSLLQKCRLGSYTPRGTDLIESL